MLHLEVLALRHQVEVLQRTRGSASATWEGGPLALDVARAYVDWVAAGARHRET